jgi:hypothetical protein
MAKQSPIADMTKTCQASDVIADASAGDVDLRTRAGCPKFAPQLTRLVNGTAAAIEVVLTLEGRTADVTYTVPAQDSIDIMMPVSNIESTGSGAAEVQCFWWDPGMLDWNAE